ncbi:hypothetical protein QBC41DRAFT_351554 [Cercophora samala]|uniref:Uncharacterized protein n=1 Tax=Cercophora samala TaxID=330535 RepID=A0AA39YKC7_9PEZI|nr:hypothetical protein QBC41DRAFT_351554 [Cercophora samala]
MADQKQQQLEQKLWDMATNSHDRYQAELRKAEAVLASEEPITQKQQMEDRMTAQRALDWHRNTWLPAEAAAALAANPNPNPPVVVTQAEPAAVLENKASAQDMEVEMHESGLQNLQTDVMQAGPIGRLPVPLERDIFPPISLKRQRELDYSTSSKKGTTSYRDRKIRAAAVVGNLPVRADNIKRQKDAYKEDKYDIDAAVTFLNGRHLLPSYPSHQGFGYDQNNQLPIGYNPKGKKTDSTLSPQVLGFLEELSQKTPKLIVQGSDDTINWTSGATERLGETLRYANIEATPQAASDFATTLVAQALETGPGSCYQIMYRLVRPSEIGELRRDAQQRGWAVKPCKGCYSNTHTSNLCSVPVEDGTCKVKCPNCGQDNHPLDGCHFGPTKLDHARLMSFEVEFFDSRANKCQLFSPNFAWHDFIVTKAGALYKTVPEIHQLKTSEAWNVPIRIPWSLAYGAQVAAAASSSEASLRALIGNKTAPHEITKHTRVDDLPCEFPQGTTLRRLYEFWENHTLLPQGQGNFNCMERVFGPGVLKECYNSPGGAAKHVGRMFHWAAQGFYNKRGGLFVAINPATGRQDHFVKEGQHLRPWNYSNAPSRNQRPERPDIFIVSLGHFRYTFEYNRPHAASGEPVVQETKPLDPIDKVLMRSERELGCYYTFNYPAIEWHVNRALDEYTRDPTKFLGKDVSAGCKLARTLSDWIFAEMWDDWKKRSSQYKVPMRHRREHDISIPSNTHT